MTTNNQLNLFGAPTPRKKKRPLPSLEEETKAEEPKVIQLDKRIIEGWENRHLKPLPDAACSIVVLDPYTKLLCKKHIEIKCFWIPYDETSFQTAKEEGELQGYTKPEGLLGTAYKLDGHINIGFSVWQHSNNEFVHYKHIEPEPDLLANYQKAEQYRKKLFRRDN